MHKHGLYLDIRTWSGFHVSELELELGTCSLGLEVGIKNLLDPNSGVAKSLVRVTELETEHAPNLGARVAQGAVLQLLAERRVMVTLRELWVVETLRRDREVVPVSRAVAD